MYEKKFFSSKDGVLLTPSGQMTLLQLDEAHFWLTPEATINSMHGLVSILFLIDKNHHLWLLPVLPKMKLDDLKIKAQQVLSSHFEGSAP